MLSLSDVTGEQHGETAPLIRQAGEFDITATLLELLITYKESKAAPTALPPAEKRVKGGLLLLMAHAAAVIFHRYLYCFTLSTRTDFYVSICAGGIARIQQKIYQDLLQMIRGNQALRQIRGKLELKFTLLKHPLMAQYLHSFMYHLQRIT